MPATLTKPPMSERPEVEAEKAQAEREEKLRVGISFKKGLTQPRYDHIYYAGDDLPSGIEGLPEGWEIHPAFLAYDAPSLRIDLRIKEEGFFFQRDSTGVPMLQQVHLTNPLYPPLHGCFYRERMSTPAVPDLRRCTLLWRDYSRVHRSASYALFAADRGSLNLRTVPLAIGNLKHKDRMQDLAEKKIRSGAPLYKLDSRIPKPKPDFTLKLWGRAGQIRYSVFDYPHASKLAVTYDPLLRLDPSQEYVLHFEAVDGLKFELVQDAPKEGPKPWITWFNAVTCEEITKPKRVEIFPESDTAFTVRFKKASLGDPPSNNWLTSFFIAGRLGGELIWTDPTVGDEGAEEPDP